MTLQIINGSKKYKENVIIESVNLTFEKGNIYGLQGDNGSGKTVVLKLLAGYLCLDKGEIKQDTTVIRNKHNYITNAGIVIENVSFLPYLSLIKNLKLLKLMSKQITDKEIDNWINYYQLEAYRHKKYKHLSLGTKQKLALIQAFIHRPDILLLDEPMNALDAGSVELTKRVIAGYKGKGLVIMTSHISENITDLCNVRYVIAQGKISVVD